VDPAGAIQQYKLTATIDRLKSLLMPWGTKDANKDDAAKGAAK
jgi:hypothetical protein